MPKDFTMDYENATSDYGDEINSKALIQMVEKLKRGEDIWAEENYDEYSALYDELDRQGLIVGSTEGGPDSGAMSTVSVETIENIYHKYIGDKK
jgi:hypothetical protein